MKSLLEMGVKSLMANQYALSATGQNIANANSPFYSRRDVVFSESVCSLYGNGVNLADVRRMYDDSLNKNAQISCSKLSQSDTYLQNMKGLETLLSSDNYSITNYINESLSALNVINANPSSPQSRDLYLVQLNMITSRFNAISNNIDLQQKNINKTISSDVNAINDLTSRLAQINGKMPLAPASERDDLLDQRDELLHNLSNYIHFDTTTQENGILSVQLNNGIPLVLGNDSYALYTHPARANPSQIEIAISNNPEDIELTHLLQQGEIGGLFSYQQNGLEDAKHALGRLALVFAEKINHQNHLGVDLNGYLGGNVFNDINQAQATKSRIINNTNNQGTGDLAVIINNPEQLTTSDYQLTFDSPSHYQLIRNTDHQVVSMGDLNSFPTSIDADGFSLQISDGHFLAGDKFTVSPTNNAATDFKVAILNGDKLAFGLPIVTDASPQNSGSGMIHLTKIIDTTTSTFSLARQLNPPIRIEVISDTSYRLINANDNSIIEDNISYNPADTADIFPTPGGFDPGYHIQLAGDIKAGDNFTLNYNLNGTGDNRNGLLLAKLYQQGILENNSLTFNAAYQSMSIGISAKVNSGQITLDSDTIIKNQAESRRDQLSGVSLQEETINLARFQQAYEASAQIIDAGKKIFDIVIGITGRY